MPVSKANSIEPRRINADVLHGHLSDYFDVAWVIEGLLYGFTLHYEGPDLLPSKILISSFKSPDEDLAVQQMIAREVRLGRILGPYRTPPFSNFLMHKIFLVDKPAADPPYRLIHDFSHPSKVALNSYIPHHWRTVQYPSVDHAVEHILRCRQGALLAKFDILDGYRNLEVRPEEACLAVFAVSDSFYVDQRLVLGCSSACKTFQRFSESLAWIVAHRFPEVACLVLIDDFLFISSSDDKVIHRQAFDFFQFLCSDIDLPLNEKKTVHPTTCLTFLGIELDTVAMEARLDAEKLTKLRSAVDNALLTTRITKKHIERLVGLLNWACRALRGARAFLRRLIDFDVQLREIHVVSCLPPDVIADLLVWKSFLDHHNGVSFLIYVDLVSCSDLNFSSDSSGLIGYGVLFKPAWSCGLWPEAWLHLDIQEKEMFAVFLGLHLWEHRLHNTKLIIKCDNRVCCDVLNAQTSRNRRLMFFVRKIVLLSLRINLIVRAQYIPSSANRGSDLLSRNRIAAFREEFPEYESSPVDIPLALLPENLNVD